VASAPAIGNNYPRPQLQLFFEDRQRSMKERAIAPHTRVEKKQGLA
jgi:hypothetical protein